MMVHLHGSVVTAEREPWESSRPTSNLSGTAVSAEVVSRENHAQMVAQLGPAVPAQSSLQERPPKMACELPQVQEEIPEHPVGLVVVDASASNLSRAAGFVMELSDGVAVEVG